VIVSPVAGTTRDVTQRHKNEQDATEAKALAETTVERWKAVVANMDEGVILIDPDGKVLDWNQAALSIHGYVAVDQLRGMVSGISSSFEIRTPAGEIVPAGMWPIPMLLRGEAFSGMELCIHRTDNAMDRIISYSGTPLRDRDGRIKLVLLTSHDVTVERRAQEELRASETQFREIFEQTPIGMTLCDLNGRYLHVNPAYCRIVGRTAEELLDPSLDFRDLIYPPDRPKMLALHRQLLAGEIPAFFLEKRYVRKDGSTVWVRVTGTVRRNAQGRPLQFVRLVEDINDRKSAEAELALLLDSERSARAEAERVSRMKDEFLATLSHELRTPLNAIMGWSQILAEGGRDAQDMTEGLKTIERNARAQSQIMEDLLDMSRIISGKIRLNVQRLDLASIVQAAVDAVRPAADAKGIRLQVVLDSYAGPVSGDPTRLQQVFWNLLSNAMKFTPKDGRVHVVLERVNSHLEVNIIDTGEGIAPEFLPYVFDRFRQADSSTTRRHGGLGLGLAIVKQLIELHGGSVRAKSPGQNRGTTFTVALPLTPVHPEPDPAPDRRHPRASTESLGRGACAEIAGVSILVVDDEPDARALIQRFLEDCDAKVTTAASAAEAIKLVPELRPDVLVSDIGMPVEDGYSLMRKVRALDPQHGGDTPAVALTAYARAEDRVNAVRAGFQHHVAKPVNPIELVAMIASLTKRVRQAQ